MWQTLTSNHVINVGFVSWSLAQILKTIITLIMTRKIHLERLMGAGGMPSSHSALAVSVAVAMLQKTGFSSPEFALAASFAMIVMYDAMGIRRAAGEQAKVLNRIVFELPEITWFSKNEKYIESKIDESDSAEHTKTPEDNSPSTKEKKLQELLGHTPFEVLGGVILGVAVALLMPMK